MSPQEWCVPRRVPDTANPGDYEMIPFDANRARFSYGYGLCGTVHAWNEPYWQALGMRARRRAFPGHVNSEVFYDKSWHAFDTDMAGILFRRDGVVAGYDDIIRDPTLVDSTKPPLPHYPYAWPADFNTMKRGWQQIAKPGNKWYRLYNSGYASHPGIVHLRTGESFTRWFDRDHYGGPTKRRFWHHLKGGPQRNWTYMNAGIPFHDGDKSNARNDASYCNGEFVYEPPLVSDKFREGIIASSDNIGAKSSSPNLYSTDNGHGTVTFRHISPYVICGDPADDANPMSKPATGGLVIEGRIVGNVPMAISNNEGLSWHDVEVEPDDRGNFRVDLTDKVKGHYGWRFQCWWSGKDGIDSLKFTTVTQVAQGIYPRLTSDGSRVTYRSRPRAVVASWPEFLYPEDWIGKLEVASLRSANVAYRDPAAKTRTAYHTLDNRPGHVVFRVDAPRPLLEVRAAVRYQLRVPPPSDANYRLEISTDQGKSWRKFAESDIPTDNEFSSGWLAGRVDVSAARVNSALVRATMYAGGHRTGLINGQFYGVHETSPPGDVDIDFGWKDGSGRPHTHSVSVPEGTPSKSFTVPTGANITNDFVRIIVSPGQ